MRIVFCYLLIKIIFECSPSVSCLNISLKTIAKSIRGGISYRFDPCVDFYSHVCNKWPSHQFLLTSNFFPSMAKDILQNRTIKPHNVKLRKERLWFDACMKATFNNEIHVMQVIVHRSGGLLLPDNSSKFPEVNRNWQNVAKFYSTRFGTTVFFNIQLNKNKILRIAKPTQRFSQELIMLDQRVTSMFDYFMPNLIQFGKEEFVIVIDQLTYLITMLNELKWRQGTVITINELQKLQNSWNTEQINWLEHLNALSADTGVTLSDSDKIQVDVNYLKAFLEILNEMPNYAIVNYIHYSYTMANEFTHVWVLTQNNLPPQERARFCVSGMPIYNGYSSVIIKDIPEERIKFVENIFQELRKVMRNEIKESWLGKKAKNYVLNILRKMKLIIRRIHVFSTEYHGQKISYEFAVGPNIVKNLINYKKAQIEFLLTEYISRKSNLRYKRELITRNQYDIDKNIIELTLGFLLEPMSRVEAPFAVNYGFLGFLIGHEMSHLFNYRNCYGMVKDKPIRTSILDYKYQCFLDQFNNYKMDGYRTMNENVADSLGLKIAFMAFKKQIFKNDTMKTEKLPGFEEFSAEKLLFYTFASCFCEVPEKNYQLNDLHSPNGLRVNGALSNSIHFAETFNCPVGSIMNPKKKCDFLSKMKLNINENNNENGPPQKRFKHD